MSGLADKHSASYRDPAGFVFEQQGVIYRQVNLSYKPHYEHLMRSGLYQQLVDENLLIPHQEIDELLTSEAFRVIKPERIPFISYPYEWCYSQLKDAALLTLQIQRISLDHGMSLKDATPYNIQFLNGRPIFIDTLSWERIDLQHPWVAYRQFCNQFLAPLAIGHYGKESVNRALLAWPEGIPLPLSSKLLPIKSWLNIDLALHIHVQAKLSRTAHKQPAKSTAYSIQKFQQLLRSLQTAIEGFRMPAPASNWSAYYEEASRRDDYLNEKASLFTEWLREIGSVELALDAGCNTGQFSLLLAAHARQVISVDADEVCIDQFYQKIRSTDAFSDSRNQPLPLCQDLAELSPARGLLLQERESFLQRGPFELVAGLALLHHLLIGRQIPLDHCVQVFEQLTARYLILEYVGMDDPWSQQLLLHKASHTHPYDQESFERAFVEKFELIRKAPIKNSVRVLYWFNRK